MKVGDKVRVITEVWDDHREKSWEGWVGVVSTIWTPEFHHDSRRLSYFVEFPKARGKWRNFDFYEEELEVVAVDD